MCRDITRIIVIKSTFFRGYSIINYSYFVENRIRVFVDIRVVKPFSEDFL